MNYEPLIAEAGRGLGAAPLLNEAAARRGGEGLKASHDWVRWGFFFVAGSFKVGGPRAGMTGRLREQTIHH